MPDVHLLELDNVSKYFGNIIALQNITTSVNAGEVTCTLGDNGAEVDVHQDPRRCAPARRREVLDGGRRRSSTRHAAKQPASPPCIRTWRWRR